MPRHFDMLHRADAVLFGCRQVLLRDGAAGLSLRKVAEASQVSPAGVVHHFGSRERMLRVIGRMFGHRQVEAMAGASRRRGLHALVPADQDELDDARVWLGWCEVARTVPSLAHCLGGVRQRRRELIDGLCVTRPQEVELDLLEAVLEGLTALCCAPGEPLPPARAAAALTRLLELAPLLREVA